MSSGGPGIDPGGGPAGREAPAAEAERLAERIGRLRELLDREGLGGAVVVRPEYVHFLTDHEPLPGYPAAVIVGADAAIGVWPFEAPEPEPAHVEPLAYKPWPTPESDRRRSLAAICAEAADRLGLDDRALAADGPLAPAGIDAVARPDLFSELTRAKDRAQLDDIARNLAGNDAAFAAVAERLAPGTSDLDVLDWCLAELCADARAPVAFEGNIGLGPAGGDPEAVPAGVSARPGDVLFVDLYPRRRHIAGDSTRSFAVGDPPPWASAAHDRLVEALGAAEERLRPGAPSGEVDRACREVLTRDGLACPHHVGHGLGVLGQEPPYVVPGNPDPIREGDVVAIEPGAYFPDRGGLRLEDVYVVTADEPVPLTRAPRELIVSG